MSDNNWIHIFRAMPLADRVEIQNIAREQSKHLKRSGPEFEKVKKEETLRRHKEKQEAAKTTVPAVHFAPIISGPSASINFDSSTNNNSTNDNRTTITSLATSGTTIGMKRGRDDEALGSPSSGFWNLVSPDSNKKVKRTDEGIDATTYLDLQRQLDQEKAKVNSLEKALNESKSTNKNLAAQLNESKSTNNTLAAQLNESTSRADSLEQEVLHLKDIMLQGGDALR